MDFWIFSNAQYTNSHTLLSDSVTEKVIFFCSFHQLSSEIIIIWFSLEKVVVSGVYVIVLQVWQ